MDAGEASQTIHGLGPFVYAYSTHNETQAAVVIENLPFASGREAVYKGGDTVEDRL